MEHTSAFTPSVFERWRRRENLLPGLSLLVLAGGAWAYTIYRASAMDGVDEAMAPMAMSGIGGIALFLFGWTAMMVAMMIPATLPLILLYRTITRKRLSSARARVGMVTLLVGYIAVWAAVGLPVYTYGLLTEGVGSSLAAVLPALLLIVGGAYQFTRCLDLP